MILVYYIFFMIP